MTDQAIDTCKKQVFKHCDSKRFSYWIRRQMDLLFSNPPRVNNEEQEGAFVTARNIKAERVVDKQKLVKEGDKMELIDQKTQDLDDIDSAVASLSEFNIDYTRQHVLALLSLIEKEVNHASEDINVCEVALIEAKNESRLNVKTVQMELDEQTEQL